MRRAVPGDAEALMRLGAAHAAFEGIVLPMGRQAGAARQQRLERALLQERLQAWLLWGPPPSLQPGHAAQALGYASLTLDFSTLAAERFAHLDCLYLEPAVRGQGWGQVLLQRASRHARAQGCRELQWQTPDWNEAAARFYRRQGAQELAKRRFILALPA
ncbi:GNAT family N-acetyltransferase [Paucibacter sp. B51]|uniref:GNAT family N-acetyltransferase n=1 Tax=Paucibacter sp. B51 TaxID=2993315 RepID=UPI0022EC0AEC|nr:GNAT family N-acetyltransferase [Paucibacter sp. B51]